MIWQAQGVKTLGMMNAKPAANREVEEEYIQHVDTPVDSERHQSRTKQGMVWMLEREGRNGDAEEAAGQCEGKMRYISWD
jgi:hypothetical protein